MKLTVHERDLLYAAISGQIGELRTNIQGSRFLRKLTKVSLDQKLVLLESKIWSKICTDLPDCLIGETGPSKDGLVKQTIELWSNKED